VQVYREALSYDAQYAAARATAEAGREKQPQALAGFAADDCATATPSGTTPDYNSQLGATSGRLTRQPYNSNTYGVNLTQPLFRWQNFVQYDQSKLLVMQTEANFAQAGQDLILRVAQAYFDVLFAIENLRAVQANKTAIAQQLEQAKKNFEVGTATITDTYESQSRFDLATAQEIAADNELEVKRYALRVLIGKDPGELNRLKPKAVMEPPQPASMEPWVDAAERDSFVVQAQQAAAEAAGQGGRDQPCRSLSDAGRGRQLRPEQRPGPVWCRLDRHDDRQIGLQLNIPIFQGGAVNSKTREAIARRDAELATLDNARRNSALTRVSPTSAWSMASPRSGRSKRRWYRVSARWNRTGSVTRSACGSTSTCSTPRTRSTSPGAIWPGRVSTPCSPS
jgi:outer membrane protein